MRTPDGCIALLRFTGGQFNASSRCEQCASEACVQTNLGSIARVKERGAISGADATFYARIIVLCIDRLKRVVEQLPRQHGRIPLYA